MSDKKTDNPGRMALAVIISILLTTSYQACIGPAQAPVQKKADALKEFDEALDIKANMTDTMLLMQKANSLDADLQETLKKCCGEDSELSVKDQLIMVAVRESIRGIIYTASDVAFLRVSEESCLGLARYFTTVMSRTEGIPESMSEVTIPDHALNGVTAIIVDSIGRAGHTMDTLSKAAESFESAVAKREVKGLSIHVMGIQHQLQEMSEGRSTEFANDEEEENGL